MSTMSRKQFLTEFAQNGNFTSKRWLGNLSNKSSVHSHCCVFFLNLLFRTCVSYTLSSEMCRDITSQVEGIQVNHLYLSVYICNRQGWSNRFHFVHVLNIFSTSEVFPKPCLILIVTHKRKNKEKLSLIPKKSLYGFIFILGIF